MQGIAGPPGTNGDPGVPGMSGRPGKMVSTWQTVILIEHYQKASC